MSRTAKEIKEDSPCIGVCILDPGWGQVCVGCHRFLIEINNWQYYSNEEKKQINKRIQDLRDEDVEDYPDYR